MSPSQSFKISMEISVLRVHCTWSALWGVHYEVWGVLCVWCGDSLCVIFGAHCVLCMVRVKSTLCVVWGVHCVWRG